jgi:hypothetical protein
MMRFNVSQSQGIFRDLVPLVIGFFVSLMRIGRKTKRPRLS